MSYQVCVHVAIQESELSSIRVSQILILPLSTIFLLGTVPTEWIVLLFIQLCPYQIMFVSFNSNMHVRRVALLEKEILTLQQELSYLRFYCGVLFVQSLVLCVVFVLLFVFLWPLCCLSFSLRLMITPLVSCGHCVVCPSVYGLWSPLWYLVATVLSVLQFTAYDHPFGILWPL